MYDGLPGRGGEGNLNPLLLQERQKLLHACFLLKLAAAGPLTEQANHFFFISIVREILSVHIKKYLFGLRIIDAQTKIIGMFHIRNPVFLCDIHPALC